MFPELINMHQLIIILLAVIGRSDCSYNTSFHWSTGDWSRCIYKDPGSCCECSRTRNVSCVYSSTLEIVPPFYCHKASRTPPSDTESCFPCQQDCVLSIWSDWSKCSADCTPGTRYRTRDVILPPQHGGAPCQDLVELDECQDPSLPLCIFTELNPEYTWVTGAWSSCRKSSNTSSCGAGIRSRRITCVDGAQNLAADNYCLYYLHDSKPTSEELCSIPCDCVVAPWSAWGPCSKTCHKGAGSTGSHGYQVRTRSVTRDADTGGAICPSLKDTRPCDVRLLHNCPRYVWESSEWDACILPDRGEGGSVCGPGLQTRHVYCVLEGGEDQMPVPDVLCVQDSLSWPNESSALKPPERRACQVTCPVDCMLGEWENWSACTQTCGTGGIRIRTRPIVQEMTLGGEKCASEGRYEEKLCEPTPCSWWHQGQWAACFLDAGGLAVCGVGSQVRSVYCLSSLDEVIADDNCTVYGPKPLSRQPCRIPCAEECTVSVWQEWTACSRTCGVQGGVQSRHRIITDPGADRSSPCLPESELEQTRVCNQVACKQYLWQKGLWLECIRMENATAMCGEGTGVQGMELTCQMDPGYPVADKYCDPDNRPISTRVCAAPCPQDCRLSGWSDWSVCSQTCGPGSYKVKFRTVLRWPLYGGRDCPEEPDPNGVILKRKACNKSSLSCSAMTWDMSEWGQCEVEGRECGKGLQQRNVSCIKDNGREVNHGMCYEEGLGSSPDHERSCHIPCAGDCRLSPWSQYTPCSQTCGATTGIQIRSRYVVNWDPSKSLSVQCPEISDSDLRETTQCGVELCPQHHWLVGDWGTCIPHNTQDEAGASCGEGIQTRHVFCLQDEDIYVPDHMCDVVAAMPRRQQLCRIHCSTDCQLSDWSSWSDCSQACGNGLRHRERKVVIEASHGGRKCRHLQEVTACHLVSCSEFDWETSAWSQCQPHWDMYCGPGVQHREVNCPAGPQYDKDCAARNDKPAETTECVKPCMGDCVMSEWSEFTHCDCRESNATRTRHRQILQEAVPSAIQCGPVTDTQICDCPTHQLVIGGWTNCQIFESANKKKECGKGVQRRPVNCLRGDGVIVHLSNCRFGNLTLSQSCEVSCPKDCRVSGYSEWSMCAQTCGIQATTQRHLSIIHTGNVLGRRCPGDDQLTQVMVCNSEPCYNYTWYRGPWHGCHSNRPGSCGVTRETRIVECHRGDLAAVDDIFCFHTELYSVTSRNDLSRKEQVDLDLHIERSCGLPCPGDCVVTEWSEYGPCIQNCSNPTRLGVQSRSRAIVRPALGGAPCPWELIQTRSCDGADAACPLFTWEVGKWNIRERRKVHCVLQGGMMVTGGCLRENQPARHQACSQPCAPFSYCVHGKCVCDPGFTGITGSCLPEFGCAADDHCFINHTYCDMMNKECLCYDDTLPGPDLRCMSGAPASSIRDPLEELNQLFIYILIGCLVALLFLGVITIVCMIRTGGNKKRRHANRDHAASNKLTKIDNLETMPRNNDKNMDTKPDPIKLDKNITRSWQNAPYTHPYHPNLSHSENETPRDDDVTSSANTSPPSFSAQLERKLENVGHGQLEEDMFSDSTEEDLSSRPFLSDSDRRSSSRGNSYSPEVRVPKPRPRRMFKSPQTGGVAVPRQLPTPAARVPPRGGATRQGENSRDGVRDQPALDSESGRSPSPDSDLTSIWIPHNDRSRAEVKDNRFPVSTEPLPVRSNREPPPSRNMTSTPPHMYENLSTPEGSPRPPPIKPRQYTPESPHPLVTDRGTTPTGRAISRRHNTEPVPTQFRNGGLRPGNTVAPSPNLLTPQQGLRESNSAKDFKDLEGAGDGANPVSPQTQDLMSYCDELLADLQRVANS